MRLLLVLSLVFALTMFFGCSESTKEEINEFEALADYLENTDPNYEGWVNTMTGWVVDYANIQSNLGDYLIVDIRPAADFAMPLTGAINTPLANIFDVVDGHTGKILVVCYTGQTSAFAHMLLRMKGYEAYSLKWGMSIVDASLDRWTNNCSNAFWGASNWITGASPALPTFDYPELNTGKDNGPDILDARITAALGVWGTRMITASTVMANPANYNIINYWSQAHWDAMGHINGAVRVQPQTLKRAQNLSVFDPSTGDNVFYCYTGQTSAAAVAYLYVLGYDVKTIAYGTNAMIHDNLIANKWPKPWSAK